VAVVLLAIALFSFGADRLFRFDRPQRVLMLVIAAGVLGWLLYRHFWRRLRRLPSDTQLCRAVENASPGLRRKLLSAFEFAQSERWGELGYSMALVADNARTGLEAAAQSSFGTALDRTRNRQHAALLAAVLAAGVALGLAFPWHTATWFQRNILLADVSWPKQTHLLVPGLRDGGLMVPEGGDLDLMIEASGLAPSVVTLEIKEGRRGFTEQLVRVGERHFRMSLKHIVAPLRFRLRGGDDITPWIPVSVMPRPKLVAMELTYAPPAYTEEGELPLDLSKSVLTVLAGGRLALEGTSTKRLKSVDCLGPGTVSTPAAVKAGTGFTATIEGQAVTSGVYEVALTDTDGLASEPHPRFTLRVASDKLPRIRLKPYGIGEMITPTADIPLDIVFRDDYAVTRATLVYPALLEAETSNTVRSAALTAFKGCRGDAPHTHRHVIAAETLELAIDEHLAFHVEGWDNDAYTGPKRGKSNTISLRVVPPDVMRYEMLRREEVQRRVFEGQLKRQQDLVKMAEEIAKAAPEEHARYVRKLRDAEKQQALIAKRIDAVRQAFEQLRLEMIHNKLEAPDSVLCRAMRNDVVRPVGILVEREVPEAVGLLAAAGRRAGEEDFLAERLMPALEKQKEIELKMTRVLTSMRRFEGYQEAVRLLQGLIGIQRNVREETQKAQEELLRRLLEGAEP
jgi:hypothetical protein